MRSKILVSALVLAAVFCLAMPAGAAQCVRSVDLIEHAAAWDGKAIVYEGEAIGEVLRRPDGAWINVSDGDNALGCWITSAMADEITSCGTYDQHGDTLRIEGIFHRACADHGGDLDLHAVTLTKTADGYPVAHPIQSRTAWGSALGIATAASAGIALWRRKCSAA
jgi:hypothetical protein